MERTRNVENSLYYAFCEKFSRLKEKDTLQTDDNQEYKFSYSPLSPFHDVTIYKNGVSITSGFVINYRDGILTFDSPNLPEDVIEADYYYQYVTVLLSFPDDIENKLVVPSIVIDNNENTNRPLELGTRKRRYENYEFNIIIFGRRDGERKDLCDIAKEIFRGEKPLIDFNQAFPLNQDGTLNTAFNKEAQTIGYLDFEDIVAYPVRTDELTDPKRKAIMIEVTVVDTVL